MTKSTGVVGKSTRRPLQAVQQRPFEQPHASAYKWTVDGGDHINIWVFGDTDLGQLLDFRSKISFDHNMFGHFASMSAFWHYIHSEEKDDRIRHLWGRKLQEFAAKLQKRTVPNFKAIILDSNYQRLCQYPEIIEELKKSTLPFDSYTVQSGNGMRIRPQFFSWLLEGLEETRQATKEGRLPNFDKFLDIAGSGIYEFAMPPAPFTPKTVKPRTNEIWQKILKNNQDSSLRHEDEAATRPRNGATATA